ncbi:MAG: hypothetical protein ACRD96_00390 [Bryobacteraceae bacterium]
MLRAGETAKPAGLASSGLVAPWSSNTHGSFTLTPLVAAVWAREGEVDPIAAPYDFDFTIAFAWPTVAAKVELPQVAPRRVAPAPAPVKHLGAIPALVPPPGVAMPDVQTLRRAVPAARKQSIPGWRLPALIVPRPDPLASARAARAARAREREEGVYDYFDPISTKGKKGEGWSAAFLRSIPSAPTVFGLCSMLFLLLSSVVLLSVPKGSEGSVGGRLETVRTAIRNRAALSLVEDFRSGLSGWQGPAGWSKDWSYDQAGFLRPGKVGLLRQSMSLNDYRVEFLGQIERKSLSWIFRAADHNNYHVAKITISKPGPLPVADLVHYAVTGGRPGPKVTRSLPFAIRNDTMYSVQMDVRGESFSARINGRMVDVWSDTRHRAGGVGFFADAGETARVRWLRVSNKDDVVGKICSYLMARANGSTDEILGTPTYTLFVNPAAAVIQ